MSNDSSSAREPLQTFRDALVESAAKEHRLGRADAEALVDGMQASGPRNTALRRVWIGSLARVTRAILMNEAEPFDLFEGAFWLRLYGAIVELPEQFTTWKRFAPTASMRDDADVLAYFAQERRVHECCLAIKAALSERELMYVALARHCHAHVNQNGFDNGFEPARKKQAARVRTTTRIATLGEDRPVAFIHAECRALEAQHGEDPTALARDITAKVADAVLDLFAASRELDAALAALDAKLATHYASAGPAKDNDGAR